MVIKTLICADFFFRRLHDPGRHLSSPALLRHASQPDGVLGSRSLPAGTIPAGELRRSPPVRLRAVQRRTAKLHRPEIRQPRGQSRADHVAASLPLRHRRAGPRAAGAVQRGRPET